MKGESVMKKDKKYNVVKSILDIKKYLTKKKYMVLYIIAIVFQAGYGVLSPIITSKLMERTQN